MFFNTPTRWAWFSGILLTVIGLLAWQCQPLIPPIPTSAPPSETAETWPGYWQNTGFGEQETVFHWDPEVRVYINAPPPQVFRTNRKTSLILYALPNGNTIEQTAGKQQEPGDDWHYQIQHIAAQTRFLRAIDSTRNYIVAYLETRQLSWPAWKRAHSDYQTRIPDLVEAVTQRVEVMVDAIVLNGHSGGGAFVNGFIEAYDSIPNEIERIAFLDSNYGYSIEIGEKLRIWFQHSPAHHLLVLAYNDSIALYQGKPFVSPTGGTWWRTRKMVHDWSENLRLTRSEDSAFVRYSGGNGRAQFILKKNPHRQILHTIQVERNGFIHSMLSGTNRDEHDYVYYGEPVYSNWIGGKLPSFRNMHFPHRIHDLPGGKEILLQMEKLSFDQREQLTWEQFVSGNFPTYLRNGVGIDTTLFDADSLPHLVRFQVLPDYWSVGNDTDFCRIPMSPGQAQRIADSLGAILPTRKMVDMIYEQSRIKLIPLPFWPSGDRNERPRTWWLHNAAVEDQFFAAQGKRDQLVAGCKKDVVLSNLIADPRRGNHVVIYGWHKPGGKPIQPQSNVHVYRYMDYSHGIRFVNRQVFVDGYPYDILEILQHPTLYRLLSDEAQLLTIAGYGTDTHTNSTK
ncbi:MAG: hypothetical protein K9N11_01070 [Lentisphaeria bacterium]|nr:hypothetical protein [Candidatus Neomarinimicrobiota bacterium]MCF7841418.1 hypothetical protein [Lentisphaeria bacterium]